MAFCGFCLPPWEKGVSLCKAVCVCESVCLKRFLFFFVNQETSILSGGNNKEGSACSPVRRLSCQVYYCRNREGERGRWQETLEECVRGYYGNCDINCYHGLKANVNIFLRIPIKKRNSCFICYYRLVFLYGTADFLFNNPRKISTSSLKFVPRRIVTSLRRRVHNAMNSQ